MMTGTVTAKDVTGYDLTRLICGSEGTLALVTGINVRLLPKPKTKRTLQAIYNDNDAAGDTVSRIIEAGIVPATLELMDKIDHQGPRGIYPHWPPSDAEAILLMDVDGDAETVEKQAALVADFCKGRAPGKFVFLHQTKKMNSSGLPAAPLLAQWPEFAPSVFDRRRHRACELPHGYHQESSRNLRAQSRSGSSARPCGRWKPASLELLCDQRDAEEMARVHKSMDEIVDFALSVGGTFTGEHGIFEGVSPRGKVQLIKKILEGKLEISEYWPLLGTCLLCETCMHELPTGVRLDSLMKAMRAEVVAKFSLPWQKRAVYQLLSGAHLLPFAMFLGRTLEAPTIHAAKGWQGRDDSLLQAPPVELQAVAESISGDHSTRWNTGWPGTLFVGCATNYLSENVGHSVISILGKLGVEVIIPRRQMCCGFPICLAGARKPALKNIRRNLEAFDPGEADAVIVDCATCGAALKKEYASVLEEMEQDSRAARELGRKVLDVTQYLSGFNFEKYPGRSRPE